MKLLLAATLLCASSVFAAPAETPSQGSSVDTAPRKLHGKFLHITDIHPDPFYKIGSDPGEACHRSSGSTGYYGAETTDCDSPFSLVNATFQWIAENLKDEIDFVIWTGDSARHDNDDRYPRTAEQVITLNKQMVAKFVEVFGKTDNINDPDPTNDYIIPIVPTYGNNDILPHNIFTPGPNSWTRDYLDVWNSFVPQEQRHSFARGGWFYTEVIPNRLAVFSLNTLYFFDSNSAVDGCDAKSEPGYEHMEWLRIQLQFIRERNMKAIITGHVPPARTESKQNWDETCYQKYTLWMRQYRDIVVTSVWGHMNIDHFMFQDVRDLKYDFPIKGIDNGASQKAGLMPKSNDPVFSIAAKSTYLSELTSAWSGLPKPPKGMSYLQGTDSEWRGIRADEGLDEEDMVDTAKKSKKGKKGKNDKKRQQRDQFLKDIDGPWAERFSLSVVSPSVVPNFFPTLRIIEYNITGLENERPSTNPRGRLAHEGKVGVMDNQSQEALISDLMDNDDDEGTIDTPSNIDISDGHQEDDTELTIMKKKKKKGKKKKKKPPFPVPKPPTNTTPPGPGYSPQTLSLISWTQLYANLTKINAAVDKELSEAAHTDSGTKFRYEIEYSTKNDSVYKLDDLTVRSWLNLAEKIGKDSKDLEKDGVSEWEEYSASKSPTPQTRRKKPSGASKIKNEHWLTFIKRAFVMTKSTEDLIDDFG